MCEGWQGDKGSSDEVRGWQGRHLSEFIGGQEAEVREGALRLGFGCGTMDSSPLVFPVVPQELF